MSSSLTDEQKRMVEESWELVKAIGAEKVGVMLYSRAFEKAPDALQLFSFRNEPNLYESSIMKWHAKNVVNHVGQAVAGLREPEKLIPFLKQLGKRHDHRDILPRHFDVVGESLMEVLEIGLGDKFTPEVREAWSGTYKTIANVMMSSMTQLQEKNST